MQSQSNSRLGRVHVGIVISGICYEACSLNFDFKKEEFFYHFTYKKEYKNKVWNYDLGKETGLPDHISFHNGLVHVNLKKERKRMGEVKPLDSVFLPSDQDTITSLLVHSIYQHNGGYHLPLLDVPSPLPENEKIGKNVWDRSRDFSVIPFLVPDKIGMGAISDRFQGLGSHAGRVLAWPGWAIDYMLTDLILPVPQSVDRRHDSAFSYEDLGLVFEDLLSQRLR